MDEGSVAFVDGEDDASQVTKTEKQKRNVKIALAGMGLVMVALVLLDYRG